jgi:hypothetical protein
MDSEIFDADASQSPQTVYGRVELFHDYIMSVTSFLRCSEKCIIMAYVYVHRFIENKNKEMNCIAKDKIFVINTHNCIK